MITSANPSTDRRAALPVIPAALVLSLLFSVLVSVSNPVLNDDAFAYLRAARLFTESGLQPVLEEYGWYTYSILIALADRLLPGDLLASAQLLNSACYLLLTWAFIAVCRQIYSSSHITLFAAAVILGFPQLNELRYYIIRDIAFWAFSFTALLNLLRFSQHHKLRHALGWNLFSLLAVLFRLEALLPLFLAPAGLLFTAQTVKQGLRPFWQVLAVLAGMLVLIMLCCMALGINLPELMQFAYRYYLPLIYDLDGVLRNTALELNSVLFTAANFPGDSNTALGMLILITAYSFTVIANAAVAFSLPLSALLLYGIAKKKIQLPAASRSLIYLYIACSLLSLLVFQLIMHFQTQRYATLLCLLLLIPVTRLLERLWLEAGQGGQLRRVKLVYGFAALYFFADSLVSFGYSKQYIADAGDWVSSELPPRSSLATNEPSIAYRSGLINDYDMINRQPQAVFAQARNVEYVALRVLHNDDKTRSRLDRQKAFALEKSFSNSRGDEIRIYKKR